MIKPANNDPCFFTQQLFLIGTYDEDGTAHFAPISWISYTWGEPSCLVISMDGKKQTKLILPIGFNHSIKHKSAASKQTCYFRREELGTGDIRFTVTPINCFGARGKPLQTEYKA